MYAILVGASVPQTDFSSSIGTAYCPIRPWTNKIKTFITLGSRSQIFFSFREEPTKEWNKIQKTEKYE